MRSIFLALAGALLVWPAALPAAPITMKEVVFHVRTGMPEAELLRELAKRRLVSAPDAATEKQLLALGATSTLIAHLKSGSYVLSGDQAQLAIQRQSQVQKAALQQAANDQAAVEARTQRDAANATRMAARGTVQSWLKDQLVHCDGNGLKPYDVAQLNQTRVFAFYASASWCGPCRKFTPKLVEAYRAVKAKHPELEVIFVSSDRNEFNMNEYMRSHAMPWPALKYRQMPQPLATFFGQSIPWLVLVGEDGRPLSKNGIDKQYIDPERIMAALDPLMTELKARGL